MANYHNSIACHLPLEILVTVASHLKKNDLLITSTHVCHLWRSTFLSSPCLWSHLVFSNEQHALVFLERSKSVPLSIKFKRGRTPSKMARESLKGITNRLATLRGAYTQSLDELLVQPLPILRHLNIFPFGWVGRTFLHMQSKRSLPSIRTLFTTNLGFFHIPNLVEFELYITWHWYVPIKLGDSLLNFFLGCLMLESIFLGYGDPNTDIEFTTGKESAEAVSLPYLHKFTHESPVEMIHIGLFNRLSLPPTCKVSFTVTTTESFGSTLCLRPWVDVFPIPRDSSCLSDIKVVTTTLGFRRGNTSNAMHATDFTNSKT